MFRKLFLGAACACLLAACVGVRPVAAPVPAGAATVAADAVVAEAWISDASPDDELDSLAVWPTEDGQAWLVVTAKATHRLVVFDAANGKRLRTVGERGDAPGRFNRPNGIAIHGDLAFVVERDNHRVQVLRLPDFVPLASFGEDVLRAPYGLWLRERAPQQLELFVTDNFMADFRIGLLPPMAELDQRVKRFSIDIDDAGQPQARYQGAFGDIGEAGALRMVESIEGDPAHDRLLIAEEDRRVGSTLRDYMLDGRYRASLPAFDADAEGVSLWACDADKGYWIASDQVAPTRFRVFDRISLQARGTFSGRVVANTDGQVLYPSALPGFPAGALFVQSDDRAVAAFDLRDVADALQLDGDCVK
ncbi:MAG: phytase [Pseudoxanthomonas sp.]